MKRLPLFVTMFILWCLLSWAVDVEHVIAGVLVSAVVAFLAAGLPEHRPPRITAMSLPYLLPAVLMLLRDMTAAFAITVYRLLLPSLPENAAIMEIETTLSSDLGRTALAVAVSLMPGTLTVDYAGSGSTMTIRVLDRNKMDKTVSSVRNYERLFAKVFG